MTLIVSFAPTAHSLEPLERFRLRDRLQDLWREKVEELTMLAVPFPSADSDEDLPQPAATVAARRATVRLDLDEVEAAMRRLDVGRYGGCEACLSSMSFEELAAQPHRRRCMSCAAGQGGLSPPCGLHPADM